MSDFVHNKGYIYPITNEEYEKLDEKYFDLKEKGFDLEVFDGQKGLNRYLVFLTHHSYGEKHDNFGSSRPCNQQEIYYHAPKFREILGEIDTAKLKFIEYCWYNCSECFDYYEEKEEYKPMTLNEAINHAKEVAASKCDECGKEHQQLAEWLQKLADYEDETPITKKWLYHNFPLCSNYCHFYYDYEDDYSIKINETIGEIRFVEVENKIDGKDYHHECVIKTIGQLRMFLTLCGLGDFVKQLKS